MLTHRTKRLYLITQSLHRFADLPKDDLSDKSHKAGISGKLSQPEEGDDKGSINCIEAVPGCPLRERAPQP